MVCAGCKRFLRSVLPKAAAVVAVIGIGATSAFADDDGHHGRHERHEHHGRGHDRHHSRPYVVATPGYVYAPPPAVVYAPPPVVYAPPLAPSGINFIFPVHIH
jgi:hypothetical protein